MTCFWFRFAVEVLREFWRLRSLSLAEVAKRAISTSKLPLLDIIDLNFRLHWLKTKYFLYESVFSTRELW